MTIEEKLQHFYDTSVAEAQTEAENTLEAHKKSLEEMFEKHKESRKMDAEAQIKAETENATREVNKALSAEQLTLRRDWTAKQNELRNELFVEVKNHLEDFMESPEYQDYLCTRIQKAREFAGNDEIFIYLPRKIQHYSVLSLQRQDLQLSFPRSRLWAVSKLPSRRKIS